MVEKRTKIEGVESNCVLGDYPHVSQQLELACRKCGKPGVYDVGTILGSPPKEELKKAGIEVAWDYSFANYFRCRHCGSGGPWDIANHLKLLGVLMRSVVHRKSSRFVEGLTRMFDGTLVQTPAMSEDYLKELIRKEPQNAFLLTRMGNIFRNCHEHSKALPWFEKAIALDPNNVEARHNIIWCALERGDTEAALPHVLPLVRSLLDGHETGKEEIDWDIAAHLVTHLRKFAAPLKERLLHGPAKWAPPEEEVFVRTLLAQEGDEDDIVEDAAERLLAGEPEPDDAGDGIDEDSTDSAAAPVELVPSLRELVEREGLNPEKLTVLLEADGQGHIRVLDRRSVPVYDGRKIAYWKVNSLAELFRGGKPPPKDIEHYPPEYGPHFYHIENHFLTACSAKGDCTDQEMHDIYSALRRRPDGKSLGVMHDFIWQVVALLLGSFVVSEAEYNGVLDALVRSTRKWSQRPVSRNYAAYLRKTFEGAKPD